MVPCDNQTVKSKSHVFLGFVTYYVSLLMIDSFHEKFDCCVMKLIVRDGVSRMNEWVIERVSGLTSKWVGM